MIKFILRLADPFGEFMLVDAWEEFKKGFNAIAEPVSKMLMSAAEWLERTVKASLDKILKK